MFYHGLSSFSLTRLPDNFFNFSLDGWYGVRHWPNTGDSFPVWVNDEFGEIPLDPRTQKASLLLLQPFPQRCCVVTIHVHLAIWVSWKCNLHRQTDLIMATLFFQKFFWSKSQKPRKVCQQLILFESSRLLCLKNIRRHLCKHVKGGSLWGGKGFDIGVAAWKQIKFKETGFSIALPLSLYQDISSPSLTLTYPALGRQTDCKERQEWPTYQLRHRTETSLDNELKIPNQYFFSGLIFNQYAEETVKMLMISWSTPACTGSPAERSWPLSFLTFESSLLFCNQSLWELLSTKFTQSQVHKKSFEVTEVKSVKYLLATLTTTQALPLYTARSTCKKAFWPSRQ